MRAARLTQLTLLVLLVAIILLLPGCGITWERSGQALDSRDLLECTHEGDRATAGQMTMAAAFDRQTIINNCLRLRGYSMVRR